MTDIKFEVMKKVADVKFKYKDLRKINNIDSNSPPSVFVGSKLKYPLVNVGILSPLDRDENAWVYDDMSHWAKENYEIRDVIKLRDSLLNSRFQSKVQDSRLNKKFVNIAQEIAIASKPVDIEIQLKRDVSFKRRRDQILTPVGLRGGLKQAKITSNVKVDRKMDKVINDELKAAEGMKYLFKNNFSEYVLSKIMSIGVLGLKKNKRLVPTRWSITATDDTLGKQLIKQIKDYKWIKDFEFFYGSFMGNCYLIMLFPNVWSYELFEIYFPGSSWNPGTEIKASTDFESYGGRKTYASNTVGGYYATRLPILQYLSKIKRQASVLAIRLETPSYWAALGVWVVRESVKKAMANRKIDFQDREEMIESSRKIGMIKYGFDNTKLLKKSRLLEQIKSQTNLRKWF